MSQYGRRKVSYTQARKIETRRSDRAKSTDLDRNAVHRFDRGDSDYSKWASHPNRFDISGIDTVGSTEYVPEARHHEKVEINSTVRHSYDVWHEKYLSDRAKGFHRKPLSVLALEKYYDSRKASFLAEGGTSHGFSDQFDKIDVATASDSWADLDSELKDKGIYGTQTDYHERARDAAREEKEIEEGYEAFLKSIGKAG